MWIMLIQKLPTKPSPPKMSIFWSTEWPGPDSSHGGRPLGKDICVNCGEPIHYRVSGGEDIAYCGCGSKPEPVTAEDRIIAPNQFGAEPNWPFARRIHYKGADIRVFPHEFSVVKPENLRAYVLGDPAVTTADTHSHDLVPDSVASERMIEAVLDGESRPIYDAALNDGADHNQAMLVALGQDITLPDMEFPPLGWYRMVPEYARALCYENEMKED